MTGSVTDSSSGHHGPGEARGQHRAPEEAVTRGTAVLVHGMWSSPADWRWVAERLRDNDVEVLAPDLPSHRTASAGLTADAAEVRCAA